MSYINIFFQTLDDGGIKYLTLATQNILIPNQEWIFNNNIKYLSKLDLILTKSQYCKNILSNYNDNIFNIGFMSQDIYNPLPLNNLQFPNE